MKKILTAILFTIILSGASLSWAEGDAPAPAAAPSAQDSPPATAPAAEALPSWLQYKPTYTGEENDIANPHRTTDEIATWAQQAAADALSFDKDNRVSKMTGFKKYFVKQGWQLYITYLTDTKVLNMVDVQGYSISTIVSSVPEIVNQGTSGGAYHWILRMPITIGFFKKDPVSGEPKPGPTGKFYLFIDILRVAEGGGDDGIAITNWRVMNVPKN